MRPYGWRFNVFFDNGDGDGTGATATSPGGVGIGDPAGAPAGTSTDAASAPGGLSGLAPGVTASLSGNTAGGPSGGAAVGSHGTQGAGPSGGGGAGGGGAAGGGGGGGPGGSAGGVGGGGHGGGANPAVSPSLVSILNQLLRGVTNPAYGQQMGTPSQNVAGGTLGVGQGGGLGGLGDAAPTSPVTVSPLPAPSALSPGMDALAQLAMMHGLLGGLAPGEASPGDTNLGLPALSPSIYGTTVGQDTGVRGGTGGPGPGANFGAPPGYGLGPPTGAATTMGFPALSVNRGNFGQPAKGQPGNFGLPARGSNVSLGPATDAAAEAAGMNPGMMALADAVSQPGTQVAQAGNQTTLAGQSAQGWAGVVNNHGPVTLQPSVVPNAAQLLAPNSPLMNELHNQGVDAVVNPDGSVTLSPAAQLTSQNNQPSNLMNMLLASLMGNPSLSSLAGYG